MRHLLIFLPGLLGSVLQKDGKDVWALSGQALGQYLRTMGTVGESLQLLNVIDDDWQKDDLGDGIEADRLIPLPYLVPRLAEYAGCAGIVQRLVTELNLTEGSIYTPREDANFFPFPYDWRRDNRATARKLQRFIEQQLPRWRHRSGVKDAQVILLAHSMGGLVARYYLEVLGGWQDCRALITFGTPHRGSLGALDTLSNGVRKLSVDLSTVARSLTSIYQLLPTYPVVDIDGTFVRVAETDAIPNVDHQRAHTAREHFHEVIRKAALHNRNDQAYRQCTTIPWSGVLHDTLQSALLKEGELTLNYSAPMGLDFPADGDGTVPRAAAAPPGLEDDMRFAYDRHTWLTNNNRTLKELIAVLQGMQSSRIQDFYGPPTQDDGPWISTRLESLYFHDEPVVLSARLVGAGEQPQSLVATIDRIDNQTDHVTQTVQVSSVESTTLAFEGLDPGLYRLTIGSRRPTPQTPAPISGIFEVIDSSEVV
jgi:pimeloyl-ACP methyl ester carboxylesterase